MINYKKLLLIVISLIVISIIVISIKDYGRFISAFGWFCQGDMDYGVPRDRITIDCLNRCNHYGLTTICNSNSYYNESIVLGTNDCICVNETKISEIRILTDSGLGDII